MKSQPGWIQFVLSVPSAVGKAMKLDFEDAAKALVSFRERQTSLLAAERSAPGREIAYVVNAIDSFS
jgi:hypothetical protein